MIILNKVVLGFICLLFYSSSIFASNGKIGLLLSELTIERWEKDKEFITYYSKQSDYEIVTCNAQNNQLTQNKQADSLIGIGVKALMVVAVDAYKASYIVEKAHTHNIKVIAYDRIILNCNLDAYVSYDNNMVGQIMAIYISMRKNSGSFAYIGGPATDKNSVYIRDGIITTLRPYFKENQIKLIIDTFASEWSENEGYKILNEYLHVKKTIPDVVFSGNDQIAKGVIRALEENKVDQNVYITGQDADLQACINIMNGKQSLTIFKPIRTLADRAVLITVNLIENKSLSTIYTTNNGLIDVPSLLLFPVPVDKNNMKNTVIAEGFHSESEIYGNK